VFVLKKIISRPKEKTKLGNDKKIGRVERGAGRGNMGRGKTGRGRQEDTHRKMAAIDRDESGRRNSGETGCGITETYGPQVRRDTHPCPIPHQCP